MNTDLNTLEKLSQSKLALADVSENLRGRKVFDANGEDIGTVEDLMVDPSSRQVRFLQVGTGGFLGIGRDHVLIPVEAIESIGPDTLRVNQTRERVGGGPIYQPDLVLERDDYRGIYEYYGYAPYWEEGRIVAPIVPNTTGVGTSPVVPIMPPKRDLPPRND